MGYRPFYIQMERLSLTVPGRNREAVTGRFRPVAHGRLPLIDDRAFEHLASS